MTEKPEPCVCGKQPTVSPFMYGKDRYFINCPSCLNEIISGSGERGAITMWNAAMKALPMSKDSVSSRPQSGPIRRR